MKKRTFYTVVFLLNIVLVLYLYKRNKKLKQQKRLEMLLLNRQTFVFNTNKANQQKSTLTEKYFENKRKHLGKNIQLSQDK